MNHKIAWIGVLLIGAAVVGWVTTELIASNGRPMGDGAKADHSAAAPGKAMACSKQGCKHGGTCDTKKPGAKHHLMTMSKQLTAALAAVESAEKAVQSGDKAKALASLAQVKRILNEARKPLAPVKVGFLNARCPIMGSQINPKKVTPGLVRKYKGGKVAFCCGGCPPAWDKLTDAQRAAKLKAAS